MQRLYSRAWLDAARHFNANTDFDITSALSKSQMAFHDIMHVMKALHSLSKLPKSSYTI